MRSCWPTILVCFVTLAGCGTTKWTDTRRAATEQLLISDAMDRAVARLDFRAVAGKSIYLDSLPISGVTDSAYLTSLLRQHMLASGCILKEVREEADYVVEVRAGAIGTDRYDVLFGMPATQVSGMLPLEGVPNTIPEMPLAKKTEQRAVAKIALFAYNRNTGRPVWQSGVVPVESTAKNIWVLGAGPFERGSIFDGTSFVGDRIKIPLISPRHKPKDDRELVSVAKQAFFSEPPEKEEALADQQQLADGESKPQPQPDAAKTEIADEKQPAAGVIPAGHAAPVATAAPGAPGQLPQGGPPPNPLLQPPGQVPPPERLPADVTPSDLLQQLPADVTPSDLLRQLPADVTPSDLLRQLPADVTPSDLLQQLPADVTPSDLLRQLPADVPAPLNTPLQVPDPPYSLQRPASLPARWPFD